MLNINDLKVGTKILFKNDPHEVIFAEHSKLGRGGGFVRSKLRNLRTGAVVENTFKGNDSISPADLHYSTVQYLYKDNSDYYFMDNTTFAQFTLPNQQVGSMGNFLKEGVEVQLLNFDNEPLNISLPPKVTLSISYTEPGIKGDTVSTANKSATLETGASIQVPLFIKTDDLIIVDTRNGSYIERAK